MQDYTLPDGWSLLSFELAQPASFVRHRHLCAVGVAPLGWVPVQRRRPFRGPALPKCSRPSSLPRSLSFSHSQRARPFGTQRSEFVGHFNVTQIIQHTNLYYATVATTGVADASVQVRTTPAQEKGVPSLVVVCRPSSCRAPVRHVDVGPHAGRSCLQGTITFYNPVSQHLPANMAPMVQTEATFTALYVVLMTSLLPYIWTTWYSWQRARV